MRYFLILGMVLMTSACAKIPQQTIAKIPEASGIAYCSNSDTLIVANDEGTYYEINTDGHILHRTRLGNYDLEGVVCEDERLFFAVENKGIMVVDRKKIEKQKISLDTSYNGKKLSLFNKKSGIEGIAKEGNRIYLSKQSNNKKNSFIAVVEMTLYGSKIIDVIKHGIADTSGLSYHEGYLYMVSDKKDILVKYDLQKKKIVHKQKLNNGAWEGIAFDNGGFVYLADDKGKVVKYQKKSLGL